MSGFWLAFIASARAKSSLGSHGGSKVDPHGSDDRNMAQCKSAGTLQRSEAPETTTPSPVGSYAYRTVTNLRISLPHSRLPVYSYNTVPPYVGSYDSVRIYDSLYDAVIRTVQCTGILYEYGIYTYEYCNHVDLIVVCIKVQGSLLIPKIAEIFTPGSSDATHA